MSNRLPFFQNVKTAFVAVGIVAMLSACGKIDPSIIRVGLATAPVTLDPRFATDATSYRICRLVYQALVDFNESHNAIPSLASWEQRTPVHYTFRLLAQQKFHDGRELSADDVVATYRSILDPATASPHRGSLSNISSVEASDEKSVEFHLKEPDPLFPGLLVIGILPANDLAQGIDLGAPIGSGPFSVVSGSSENRLRLRRTRDAQIIDFITVRDATVRALKLIHHELDLMQGSMSPELVDWLNGREGIDAVHRSGTTFTYLGFNLDDPILKDRRIREAIAYAIDRQALTHYMFGGRARLAQAIFTPTHWAGHKGLPPIPHDPEKARVLLKAVGYDSGNPLRLVYKTSSDHFRLRIATAIQDQLSQVGIDLEISSYDWGTFYADIKNGRFQMYSLSWVGLKQPDIFRYVFHSASAPPEGANRGHYRSTSVDRLIEAAEGSDDLEERAALYREIQSIILADLPYVPLWYEDNVLIMRTEIENYDMSVDGYYDGLAKISRRAVASQQGARR